MREKWTGEAVKLMHIHNISQTELAIHINKSREWVCKILNGIEKPLNAQSIIESAINEIIEERS